MQQGQPVYLTDARTAQVQNLVSLIPGRSSANHKTHRQLKPRRRCRSGSVRSYDVIGHTTCCPMGPTNLVIARQPGAVLLTNGFMLLVCSPLAGLRAVLGAHAATARLHLQQRFADTLQVRTPGQTHRDAMNVTLKGRRDAMKGDVVSNIIMPRCYLVTSYFFCKR